MPFIGTFLRKLEHFAFDRNDPQARLRQASEIEAGAAARRIGLRLPGRHIYAAEGVRPFQLGAFKAAATVHCPILPVALAGTRSFLRDGSYLPRPAKITVTVCPPLVPIGPPDSSRSGELEWREIVRLRDEAREPIGRFSGEPLL